MRDLAWPQDPELTEEEAVSIAEDLLNRFGLPHVIMDTARVRERTTELLGEEAADPDFIELVKTSTEWFGALSERMGEEGDDMLDNAIMEYDHDRNL